jgi:SAM-dependent methyltransferase
MNDPAARGAYLAFFVPQYAAKIAAVLERSAREAHLVLPAAPRVLDVGAGPLSGTLGAWLACGALGPSVAVDLSGRALESGRDILRSLAPAADVRLVEAPVQRRPLPPGPFDLVIVAHVLNELGDPRRGLDLRAELVRDLTSTLAPGGRVLVVEPGTRVHGRALMALRDRLVADGLTLHAPCVGAKKCPLLQTAGDWCHAEEPWRAPEAFVQLERAAGLTKTVLKHSYLLVSREPARLHGVRLVGGVMQPARGTALRYGCGPRGLVTLALDERAPAAARSSPRGALLDEPAPTLSSDRAGSSDRRGAASGPRHGGGRAGPRRR